ETFCQALYSSLQQHDLFGFLSQLNQDNVDRRLYWLLSLLLDALKYQTNAQAYCINQDQQPLIMALSQSPSNIVLAIIDGWK
ncbi:DNA polymerase III subunit delta' C-terminal domain-containing protein, partial [Escherichia coli]|uniref:DNA polymerase III subunit delta' C-terminal domain-containing protein n=1 Tax=Escherichia coli TaxID=562 RepID=UPI0025A96003